MFIGGLPCQAFCQSGGISRNTYGRTRLYVSERSGSLMSAWHLGSVVEGHGSQLSGMKSIDLNRTTAATGASRGMGTSCDAENRGHSFSG
jgi:hypothetical protein